MKHDHQHCITVYSTAKKRKTRGKQWKETFFWELLNGNFSLFWFKPGRKKILKFYKQGRGNKRFDICTFVFWVSPLLRWLCLADAFSSCIETRKGTMTEMMTIKPIGHIRKILKHSTHGRPHHWSISSMKKCWNSNILIFLHLFLKSGWNLWSFSRWCFSLTLLWNYISL